MKKPRILIDNLFVNRGGVEVMMWSLISYLTEKGCDVTLAAVHWPGNEETDVIPPGVHFIQRYKLRRKDIKSAPLRLMNKLVCRIYDACTALRLSLLNFDIAIAMQEKRTMLRTDGLRAKRKIAWIHTDYATRLKEKKPLFASPEQERACMARFEKVICVSETAKKGVITTVGDPGNLYVRSNPIDVNRIRTLSQASCPLEHKKDKPLLISVGRLVAEKQYLMLLEACRELSKTLDFELWIVGDGEERPALEAYIAENGLSSRVRLLGTQTNPFQYVRQADLFISSSSTEGYGLTIQEALLLGVPVAAVNCPAVEESLDPKYGLLVGNSAEALRDGIASLLKNPELLRQYQKNIAQGRLDEEVFEKRLDAIYSLLMDTKK